MRSPGNSPVEQAEGIQKASRQADIAKMSQ